MRLKVSQSDNEKGQIPLPVKGLKRVLLACGYSLAGMRTAWREEAAFRQICFLFAGSASGAFILAQSWLQMIILILPAWICLIVELINTAIENAVDLATPQWHPLAKKAKDLGSGAQFASQLLVVFVWISFLMYEYF